MHVFFGIPIRGYPFKRRISPSLLVRFPFGIVEPQDSVEVVILRDRTKVLNSKYITLICKLFKDKSREHFLQKVIHRKCILTPSAESEQHNCLSIAKLPSPLGGPHLCKFAARLFAQLFWVSMLNDCAPIHNDHLVKLCNSLQSMGNHDNS